MDAKQNTADVDGKPDDWSDEKQTYHDSPTTAAKSAITPYSCTAAHTDLQMRQNAGVNLAPSMCEPQSVNEEPRPLFAPLPSSTDARTISGVSETETPISTNKHNLKTVHAESSDAFDICASILMGCLFCHPLDCLSAAIRGCYTCVWSLCSSVCSCEPAALQSLVDITHCCDLCSCLGIRSLVCDCSICDMCLQATECLDLAMEMSQMLYH
ncbi:myoD family inhibitor domain-containing protein 2 [Thalassophryne amazonica]|uniref:myoD family inhibitor domain-containing protein 2 n=1 Tax=Thalassophryne amazonica TaxID=390379 RepID=UPI001471D9C8|nr:myoD family inhibitor domain-containing protein 2 [Thalassophryne amazonica]